MATEDDENGVYDPWLDLRGVADVEEADPILQIETDLPLNFHPAATRSPVVVAIGAG